MGEEELPGENSSMGKGTVWAWWLSVFVSSFGACVDPFRFICRPILHLITQYPGMFLNHAERLTAKMSWTMFPLHYLIAD